MISTIREKGYINLNKILNIPSKTSLKELIELLKNDKRVTIQDTNDSNGNFQLVFSFKYNEIEYFYKYDCPKEPFKVSPYNELISCEIADDLKIPHVDYALATIGGFKGLISQDFRKSNVKYISGKEFLIANHPLGNKDNITSLNNLEDIWLALEKHYNMNPTYQNVVSDVMNKIVKMFIFDIITGQVDRDYSNWYLIEYPDGTLDLQPLFDNIRILMLHHRLAPERYPEVSKILLTVNQDTSRFCEENLEEFLKISDEDFIDSFSNSLWVISLENIQEIFKRIEKKTGYPIPEELKSFYLKEFATQLYFLKETYSNVMSSEHKSSFK